VEEANTFAQKSPFLVFGLIGTVSGVSLFYLLPLAGLNMNLSMLFDIFFFLLVAMICGWSLIALNF
jgi:hypothetical protein